MRILWNSKSIYIRGLVNLSQAFLFLFAVTSSVSVAQITTKIDVTSGKGGLGAIDSFWEVDLPGPQLTFLPVRISSNKNENNVGDVYTSWVQNTCGSFISPFLISSSFNVANHNTLNNEPVNGTYTYQGNFNLSSLPILNATLDVSFILADDEVLAIRINGIPVQSLPNITTASPGSFSLPIAGLSPGLNTIEIEVRNSGLWTALEICGEIVVEQECDGILNNVEVELTEPNCSDDKMYAAYKDVFPWFVYEWDYGDGTIEIGSQPRHLFTNPGSYQVGLTITDTLCNNEYFFDFMIDVPDRTNRLFIPNAFSPNGDLLNDVFEIKGDECLVNSTFGIYDAWGQRVFYTDNPFVEFWDGTIDGAMAMDDVYVYRFESEELNKTGRVTLIK